MGRMQGYEFLYFLPFDRGAAVHEIEILTRTNAYLIMFVILV